MRILVFSDSHGNHQGINEIIDKIPADAVIHCGDVVRDCIKIKEAHPDMPFYYVCGNNDYSPEVPRELSIELGGKKIFITHGHLYNTKRSYDMLRNKIKEGHDLVVFGHTHISYTEYFGGGTLLNPGSMSNAVTSYAVVEIEDGILKTAIIDQIPFQ